jgi:hypothetical protein
VNDLKYKSVGRIELEQALDDLESSDPDTVASALHAVSRSGHDIRWIESECIRKLTSPEVKIRWAAATCLGDLAFFRRELDLTKVVPALKAAIHDPTISDPATFSLSMVMQFLAPKAGSIKGDVK